MIYILACDNIALFQSQIRGFGEFRAGGDAKKKKKHRNVSRFRQQWRRDRKRKEREGN